MPLVTSSASATLGGTGAEDRRGRHPKRAGQNQPAARRPGPPKIDGVANWRALLRPLSKVLATRDRTETARPRPIGAWPPPATPQKPQWLPEPSASSGHPIDRELHSQEAMATADPNPPQGLRPKSEHKMPASRHRQHLWKRPIGRPRLFRWTPAPKQTMLPPTLHDARSAARLRPGQPSNAAAQPDLEKHRPKRHWLPQSAPPAAFEDPPNHVIEQSLPHDHPQPPTAS